MGKRSTDRSKMSIGALARATGVPVETLRTWERRYGFPEPVRTPSGHRRYAVETVGRLRLVRRAVDLGHKPSVVLRTPPDELRELLDVVDAARLPVVPGADAARLSVESWLDAVQRFDAESLDRGFLRSWGELGVMRFLTECVGPFLEEIGHRWAAGRLGVRHEHFVSERLRDFLSERWSALSAVAPGPRVVCATLAGEEHGLGLHMAATALTLSGVKVLFLGTDTPVEDIAAAADEHGAAAVVLSASSAADRDRLRGQVRALQAALTNGLPIVAGGRGFDASPAGIEMPEGLVALKRWAENLVRAAEPVH